jgi:hypothetical protein
MRSFPDWCQVVLRGEQAVLQVLPIFPTNPLFFLKIFFWLEILSIFCEARRVGKGVKRATFSEVETFHCLLASQKLTVSTSKRLFKVPSEVEDEEQSNALFGQIRK